MKRWTLVLMGALVVWTISGAPSTARAGEQSGYDADDTGRNVRDRGGDRPTAGTQSNKRDDVEITRDIRRAIVDDDTLSTNAHNVKVITIDGAVTLRGPVDTPQEKARVAAKARQVAGVKHVDNQIEVTKR